MGKERGMFLWAGCTHNAAGSEEAVIGSQQTPSEVQTNLYILKSLEPTRLPYCIVPLMPRATP